MVKVPQNLLYTSEHIWIKRRGNVAKIGLTEWFMEFKSGEIEGIEILEDEGAELDSGVPIFVVNGAKGSVEVQSPFLCRIKKINGDVVENPTIIMDDPYGDGWIIEIEIIDDLDLEVLKPQEYKKLIEEEMG